MCFVCVKRWEEANKCLEKYHDSAFEGHQFLARKKTWDQNGWFFYSLGTGARGLLPLGLLGFPSGSLVFWWPWLLMHSVRRKPLSLYKNYIPPHFKLNDLFSRGSKFSWSWSWEFCFSGWYLCQRGERCGRWDGFGLLAALSCILWWQIPLRQEPIMAGPAGLSKRSVGLRLSDE